MSRSPFAVLEMAPRDPILGLLEAFNHDNHPKKVNLGVGVYFTDEGRIPVLHAVAEAEKQLAAHPAPRGYLPIDGIAAYDKAVQELLLGADSPLIAAGKVVTAQALGGTGGLKIGADLLSRALSPARAAISDPSWENHRALFMQAGFEVDTYPYYDAAARGMRFDAMLAALQSSVQQRRTKKCSEKALFIWFFQKPSERRDACQTIFKCYNHTFITTRYYFLKSINKIFIFFMKFDILNKQVSCKLVRFFQENQFVLIAYP